MFESGPGQGLLGGTNPRGPFNCKVPICSSQGPDQSGPGPASVRMMVFCVGQAGGSRVSLPRQDCQGQLGEVGPAGAAAPVHVRAASRHTAHSKQLRIRACHD